MAPNTQLTPGECKHSNPKISTFAVVDIETSNLPANNLNRAAITELCIYAFDSEILKQNEETIESQSIDDPMLPWIPSPPRVLHKLNLVFRPGMLIDPIAEKVTGLDNFLLERESTLNENAVQMILNFIEHLPAPVCLVAHNGWPFDYPIIKKSFNKLKMQFPSSVLCVDSLRAFMEIDDKRKDIETELKLEVLPEILDQTEVPGSSQNSKIIDWQSLNETTPTRPTLLPKDAFRKRKLINDGCEDEDSNEELSSEAKRPRELHARRQLFSGLKCAETKRFPPRGQYKLGNLFERIFLQPAMDAHRAEGDVNMLTKLMQHYGVDFLAFAEEQAIPFAQVVPLGGQ